MDDSKKLRFSTPPILKIFLQTFQGLVIGLVGMYFDAAVIFVETSPLLFRLALAIL